MHLLRSFGDRWVCDLGPGSGIRQCQHVDLLAVAAVALQCSQTGNIAASQTVGGQSHWVPWFGIKVCVVHFPPNILNVSTLEIKKQVLVIFGLSNWCRAMDVYEIALNFTDPQHQGDRRKKSQQCFLASFTIFSFFCPSNPSKTHWNNYLTLGWFYVIYQPSSFPAHQVWPGSRAITVQLPSRSLVPCWDRWAASNEAVSLTYRTLTLIVHSHHTFGFLGFNIQISHSKSTSYGYPNYELRVIVFPTLWSARYSKGGSQLQKRCCSSCSRACMSRMVRRCWWWTWIHPGHIVII